MFGCLCLKREAKKNTAYFRVIFLCRKTSRKYEQKREYLRNGTALGHKCFPTFFQNLVNFGTQTAEIW